MAKTLTSLALLVTLLPMLGCLIAGILGKFLGRKLTHRIVISLVGISFALSVVIFKSIVIDGYRSIDHIFYTWASAGSVKFNIGFLIDRLSATMAMVVTFVSFMVHIYTIGYMADDPGYTRFFSYVSMFTFAMLSLVFADNFLLIFFGWEAVGLVSYLLIGFWFKKESANLGSLKAFLVNRVGDIGFLLAIALVLMFFNSLNYHEVFQGVTQVVGKTLPLFPNYQVDVINLICILLFIGAMGKSAQVPLHVWLPESMEGPTPISALIHAATMVTAGIYMVARMSPLFEYSPTTLSIILVLGGTTAFFMGLLAIVQFDIKRVIAYSTISQLGYMVVALGASAYDAAIFHLVTHAFFKALLFLAAGSVIIALHHEQDMRKMGGLARALPVTYGTFLVGSLALCAIPPFAGFYSKDTIIEAVHLCQLPGATYAYYCVLFGAFVTSVYTFRAFFMTFHGKTRVSLEQQEHTKESPWVVLLPLVALGFPSLMAGEVLIGPMLYAKQTILGNTLFVLPQHDVMAHLAKEFPGAKMMALSAGRTATFWLALSGIAVGWLFTLYKPAWATALKQRFKFIYNVLLRKYGFDDFNDFVFVRGTNDLGHLCYDISDVKLIDDTCVNGSGKLIQWLAAVARRMQTGYLYHYALAMVIGMLVFLGWYVGGI